MRFMFLWLILLAACATDERNFQESILQLRPQQAPTFLNSDFAKAFGGRDFSAQIEIKSPATGLVTGSLAGHGGNLFLNAGKAGALWDAPSGTAYLLNDPLQGYAPISNSVANVVVQALGQEGLPQVIRILSTSGETVVTLTRLELKSQPPELFLLPNGFKRYPNIEAMTSELASRRGQAIDARNRQLRAKYGTPKTDEPVVETPRQGRY